MVRLCSNIRLGLVKLYSYIRFHTWGKIIWQSNRNTITGMSKYTKHTHTHTHYKRICYCENQGFSCSVWKRLVFRKGVSSSWGHTVDIRSRLPCFRVGTRVCHLTSPEHTTKTTVDGQQVRSFLQIHQSLLWISGISATTLANIATSN